MLGWGVPTFDSQYALQSLLRTVVDKTADGDYNLGRYSNPKVDARDRPAQDRDRPREARPDLARGAGSSTTPTSCHIPLHHQVIPWAMRSNVTWCTAPTTG